MLIYLQTIENSNPSGSHFFPQKEALNLTEEASYSVGLDFLKKQTPPGPFSTSNEVTTYMTNEDFTDNEESKRLCESTYTLCKETIPFH